MTQNISQTFQQVLPLVALHLDESGLIEMGAVSKAVYECVSANKFWKKHLYTEDCKQNLAPGMAKEHYLQHMHVYCTFFLERLCDSKKIIFETLKDPAIKSDLPSLLHDYLAEELHSKKANAHSSSDATIQMLLHEGAEVREKEWRQIQNLCCEKTIQMVRERFNLLAGEENYFSPISEKDPSALKRLKEALINEWDIEEELVNSVLYYLDNNELSEEILEALERQIAPQIVDYSSLLHYHIVTSDNEEWILKLLARVETVNVETFLAAVNKNYSSALIAALARKVSKEIPLRLCLKTLRQKHFEAFKILMPKLRTLQPGTKPEIFQEFIDNCSISISPSVIHKAGDQAYSSRIIKKLTGKKASGLTSPPNEWS